MHLTVLRAFTARSTLRAPPASHPLTAAASTAARAIPKKRVATLPGFSKTEVPAAANASGAQHAYSTSLGVDGDGAVETSPLLGGMTAGTVSSDSGKASKCFEE